MRARPNIDGKGSSTASVNGEIRSKCEAENYDPLAVLLQLESALPPVERVQVAKAILPYFYGGKGGNQPSENERAGLGVEAARKFSAAQLLSVLQTKANAK